MARNIRAMILAAAAVGLFGVALKVASDRAAREGTANPAYAAPQNPLATPPPGAAPDHFVDCVVALAGQDHLGWLLLALVLLAALLVVLKPQALQDLRASAGALGGYLVMLPVCGLALSEDATLGFYGPLRFVQVLLMQVALAGMAALFVSEVATRVVRKQIPRILMDIILVGVYLAIGLSLLSSAGFNVSGIIATSAVLTAVIGFSLQDTLSNLMSGVVLEVESVINEGDWVRIGDVEGQVKHIRWRQTTIQTRNWDLALVPNSVLMKNQVIVYGRRDGKVVPHRQWVWFTVELSTPPSRVIETVLRALQDGPLENVVLDPKPTVVMMEFKDGVGIYAARYFMPDMGPNDLTDTRVRERIYAALNRANIRITAPHRTIQITQDTEERLAARARRDHQKKLNALKQVDLFSALEPAEMEELAEALTPAPYGPREVITRQGDPSDCLFLMVSGSAAVEVGSDGLARKVAELHGGSVFGEMGVLTGEPRSATVTAMTQVECWRMDRTHVEGVIKARPELAKELSSILAKRQVALAAARQELKADVEKAHALRGAEEDILGRIRKFLGVG